MVVSKSTEAVVTGGGVSCLKTSTLKVGGDTTSIRKHTAAVQGTTQLSSLGVTQGAATLQMLLHTMST
jgi:hypothetical protein